MRDDDYDDDDDDDDDDAGGGGGGGGGDMMASFFSNSLFFLETRWSIWKFISAVRGVCHVVCCGHLYIDLGQGQGPSERPSGEKQNLLGRNTNW